MIQTEAYYEVREEGAGPAGKDALIARVDDADEAAKRATTADAFCHGRITIWHIKATRLPVPWATTDGM